MGSTGSAAPDDKPPQGARRRHRQSSRTSPFAGSISPASVPLLVGSRRPSLPFPHPWNYRRPLDILETYFWNADQEKGSARHSRYLKAPGFAPVLVTRDPRLIRAISAETGDKPGQFDRDTMPSAGIARATGHDTLLYANGPEWKRQKKLSAHPFARSTLFQPEQFQAFEETFRATVSHRLELLRTRIVETGEPVRLQLEPEIKAIMLELLVNNFFGAEIPYDEIRDRFGPSLDRVIDHIVRDTVINKLGLPLHRIPSFTRSIAETKRARADFEALTDLVIRPRSDGKALWRQFRSDAPDEALRGNIRVFLAGALEATTSFASWAISHLSRSASAQEKLHAEIAAIDDYTPEHLANARYLNNVLDETLRLTPALYFHPRRATADVTVTTSSGDTLRIPRGTHILLDVWHANRHEDHWGVSVTGHPAIDFVPERWDSSTNEERNAKDMLHFGFGHGPRFCPGKSLGQLEVALVVGACVKLFRFKAVNPRAEARAGVSTKPLDGALVDLWLRPPPSSSQGKADTVSETGRGARGCPFRHAEPSN